MQGTPQLSLSKFNFGNLILRELLGSCNHTTLAWMPQHHTAVSLSLFLWAAQILSRSHICTSFHSMLFHCQFKSMHREKYVREKDLRTDANASQQNNVLQGMWPPAAHQQPERKLPPILRLLAEKAKDHRMGWRTNQDLQAEACIQSHNHCGHSQLKSKCLQACLKL